jgi:DNA-binding NtrC family response regulator
LQDGEIQQVGTGRIARVNVRVIACTHRDLAEDAKLGRFRADLYYRLAVVTLKVPPLRERSSDIAALVDAFRRKWSVRFDMPDVQLGADVVAALAGREWPGNVRELENAVAALLAMSDGHSIGVEALGTTVQPTAPASRVPLRARVDAYERSILADTLAETGGNQSEAARRLGITRSTLIEKLKRHGL